MKQKTYLATTSLVFLIILIVHLLRIFNQWDVMIGQAIIPLWVSWVAVILLAYLLYSAHLLRKNK